MKQQIILHGAPTGNCYRATIALAEAGVPHTVHRLLLRNGEHKQAAYLALNPLGQVPALEVAQDGQHTVITQSNAIMFYAAEAATSVHLLGETALARARVFERFFYFLTEVIGPSHASFLLKGAAQGDAAQWLDCAFLARLAHAETFLQPHAYMAGDTFTLADIAGYTIAYAYKHVLDWPALPRLHAWYQRIAERPGVQRGMSAFAVAGN